MSKKIVKATHVGELKIGDTAIPCAVLEDGTRLLTQEGFLKAIGRAGKAKGGHGASVAKIPAFLSPKNLKPFISEDLIESTKPVRFRGAKGTLGYGYKADLLPKVCEVYLRARDENALLARQKHIVAKAEILMRGLAHIGIIALVDEATGYQYDRARRALEEILDKFISKELRKWAKTFPDEFYEQMFRLRGWQYVPFSIKRPGVVGKYTNDLVYRRLAPEVLNKLKEITPRDSKGRTKHRYFQRLTEDVGHPRLREHLAAVIALMKASTKWDQFYRLIQRALPRYGDNLELPFDDLDK